MSMYKDWGRKGYIRECVNKLKEYLRARGKKNEKTMHLKATFAVLAINYEEFEHGFIYIVNILELFVIARYVKSWF